MVNGWVLFNKFFNQGKPILDFKDNIMMSLIVGAAESALKPASSSLQISAIRNAYALIEADGPKSKNRKR